VQNFIFIGAGCGIKVAQSVKNLAHNTSASYGDFFRRFLWNLYSLETAICYEDIHSVVNFGAQAKKNISTKMCRSISA